MTKIRLALASALERLARWIKPNGGGGGGPIIPL